MSPNKPKTQHRSIRIPDELWDAVKAKALSEGTDASKVVNRLLEQYVQ
jgi:hypothetical protein